MTHLIDPPDLEQPQLPPATEPGRPAGPSSPRGRAVRAVAALLLSAALGATAVVALRDDATVAQPAVTSVVRDPSSVTSVAGTPESAAAVIGPRVVTVEVSGTTSTADNPFFGAQPRRVSGTGSGVVIRVEGSTGWVLTNNHVVAAAADGGAVHVTLRDGRTVAATLVGRDPTSDLAVLKVTGVSGLTAAVFADSDALKVGQAVLAVGAPLGLSNTVTQGIVSTLHRPVATGEPGAGAQAVLDAVQTDAAINPGNSGGALVDLAGRVVGINSAIASTGSSGQAGNIGVGFAIPSNDAAAVADQLIATGHATHAQIGVSVRDAASSTDGAPGLGATVGEVVAGSPADKAGLRAGDVITKLGDRVVTDADSLVVAVRANDPGTKVRVEYERGGEHRQTTATLVAAPST